MTIDVSHTAEAIEDAARRLRQAADDLDHLAAQARSKNSLEYASEAVQIIVNVIPNCRLDLLVTRPLRALGIR